MALCVGAATVVAVSMWRTHARGAALLSGPRDWVACIGMLACHALNGTRILTARGGRRVASPLAAALGMVAQQQVGEEEEVMLAAPAIRIRTPQVLAWCGAVILSALVLLPPSSKARTPRAAGPRKDW